MNSCPWPSFCLTLDVLPAPFLFCFSPARASLQSSQASALGGDGSRTSVADRLEAATSKLNELTVGEGLAQTAPTDGNADASDAEFAAFQVR